MFAATTKPAATRSIVDRSTLGRSKLGRSKLDWAIVASVLLMLAMNLVATCGDLGPSAAYAAVPM